MLVVPARLLFLLAGLAYCFLFIFCFSYTNQFQTEYDDINGTYKLNTLETDMVACACLRPCLRVYSFAVFASLFACLLALFACSLTCRACLLAVLACCVSLPFSKQPMQLDFRVWVFTATRLGVLSFPVGLK